MSISQEDLKSLYFSRSFASNSVIVIYGNIVKKVLVVNGLTDIKYITILYTMKTLNECIAEGFKPTRKYGWFEYKRDYVRKIWNLAEKMGFEKNFGYNRWCYYYNIELPVIPNMPWWANHNRGYYFIFFDCDGQCLPEMRMFISNPQSLDTALLSTYPVKEEFKYKIVPEKIILDMFTRFDHPDKFLLYLENWNTNNILESLL